ncbi:MAG: hypothetical protein R3E34_06690 [Rhodocyclaceae bacterium]
MEHAVVGVEVGFQIEEGAQGRRQIALPFEADYRLARAAGLRGVLALPLVPDLLDTGSRRRIENRDPGAGASPMSASAWAMPEAADNASAVKRGGQCLDGARSSAIDFFFI